MPEWRARFVKAPVRRGRSKADVTKISTILRLDPDVLAAFRASGPGWQSRINAALRKAAGLPGPSATRTTPVGSAYNGSVADEADQQGVLADWCELPLKT